MFKLRDGRLGWTPDGGDGCCCIVSKCWSVGDGAIGGGVSTCAGVCNKSRMSSL